MSFGFSASLGGAKDEKVYSIWTFVHYGGQFRLTGWLRLTKMSKTWRANVAVPFGTFVYVQMAGRSLGFQILDLSGDWVRGSDRHRKGAEYAEKKWGPEKTHTEARRHRGSGANDTESKAVARSKRNLMMFDEACVTIGGIRRGSRNLSGWCNLMRTVVDRIRWKRSARHVLSACLLGLCVGPDATRLAAADGLPPVRQLISETLALCNVDRDENKSALNDLAAAQCYLGEFAAARENLSPYTPDDIFQQAAHQACAQIEIEITGSTVSIPKALWNDDFGFMHCDAALAFVEIGEIGKALQQIAEVPRSVHSSFNVFGPKLIQKLKARKENEACRKVLLQWASCYERTESIFHYRDSHRVSQLVAWLVEFQEKAAAAALCERWHAVVQAETDIDECGESIGRTWAGYALAMNAIGDKDAASRALNEANRWMDRAWTASRTSIERVKNFDFACAYAAIAARRAIVLGEENSVATLDHAIQLARITVDTEYGEYAFEKIVVEQLNAGDTTGARETIKLISQPRTIARAWKVVCQHDREKGDIESARLAARAAVQAIDRDGFEPFMAQEMAPVASVAALAGEKELARKLFQRAIDLSAANEMPKFNHPWIAGIQVNAGLLEDAYRTIQLIEEPPDRTRPLSHLCRAMAKAEYEANRNAPGRVP